MSRRRRAVRPPLPLVIVDAAHDRARSCERKDAYESQAHARAVAAMNGTAQALVPYECRYCGFWHVARRKPPEDPPG
ncbi:MAG: hypothetical protein ACYDHD_10020 [Vulcanimicrobiaceae bacterium]